MRDEAETAWRIKTSSGAQLASQGVPLVHLSTNYVFDGRRRSPTRRITFRRLSPSTR